VVAVPGPSALITALSSAGLPTNEFVFAGFLPARPTARKARLQQLSESKTTLILYEAPHRIKATIEDAREAFGERECVIARELTKLHEEFLRGRLSEIEVPEGSARGEFVVLIGPPLKGRAIETSQATLSVSEQVEQLINAEGLDQKSALKRVARERGIGKSEAYRLMISERARSNKP
ncbi:MAG: SAM-dependent methyltransferase, partial [Blastocatellia bacterium]